MAIGQGVTGLLNFGLIIFIVRQLGAVEYGKFAYAYAFVSIFSTLFDFGLSTTVTREFAKAKEQEQHFCDLLIIKGILGVICTLIIIFAAIFIVKEISVIKCIMILVGYVFAAEMINLCYGFFRARRQMEIESIFRILHIFLQVIMVTGLYFHQFTIIGVSVAYAAAALICLGVVIIFFSIHFREIIKERIKIRPEIWKYYLGIGLFIALSKGVGDIMQNGDSILLGYFGYLQETGWYNAAGKINSIILFPMAFITSGLFPTLVVLLQESPSKFISYLETWIQGATFVSLLVCCLIFTKTEDIIIMMYSDKLLAAADALRIICFAAGAVWIYSVYYHVLLIFNQQRLIFRITACVTALNVSCNLYAISHFGFVGAATTYVVSHILIFVCFIWLSARHTIFRPLSKPIVLNFIYCFLASISLGLFLHQVHISLLVSLALGTAIYTLVYLICRRSAKVLGSWCC